MKGHLAILDGDDTLWSVEGLYDDALDRAQERVEAHGLPGDRWRTLQRQLDLVNVLEMGTSAARFPLSSVQAVDQLAHEVAVPGGPALDALRSEVEAISCSVFTAAAPLVPAVEDVLGDLGERMRLVLLTKGDRQVQERRIAESGLRPLLDDVVIVEAKSPETFGEIVRASGVVPGRAWSIGNSIPSDINPAVAAGLNAVWVDSHVWEYERREGYVPHPRVMALPSLKVVPEHLLPLLRDGEG